MKYRIFLDTNVIFAALYNKKGKPAALVLQPRDDVELLSSSYVLSELERLIEKRYPLLGCDLGLLSHVNFIKLPDFHDETPPIKAKDLPVLRGAQYLACDYLVTGDLRDFSPLMKPSFSVTTRIICVARILKILSAR